MIHTYLDLSTCHLTARTMRQLQTLSRMNESGVKEGWPAMSIAAYHYGAFVTVPNYITADEMAALPEDLHLALGYASGLGVAVVCFDSAGHERPELPTYEW